MHADSMCAPRAIKAVAAGPEEADAAGVRRRSLCLPAASLALAACAPGPAGPLAIPVVDLPCGLRAAMSLRQPGVFRERPPACALPSVEEVAMSCAINDMITAPDYRPPDYDQKGVAIDPQPAPVYTVSDLSCRFSAPERNRADCAFTLLRPNGPGTPEPVRVAFEHRFWQDHGPAHHVYGTLWSPISRCAQAGP